MSGKGSKRRPLGDASAEQFGNNFDAIFRGMPERPKGGDSNSLRIVGSNPTPAANYIDDATGAVVDENWWPATDTGHPPIQP